MKKVKFCIEIMAIVMSCAFTVEAQNKKKSKDAEITYKVDLHCESCKKKMEAAVPYIK